jgi:deoxyribodipyrimidine photo-lyase
MALSLKLPAHIFRLDLRLPDNTALRAALASSPRVLPCFIFDGRQTGDGNQYRSLSALRFMTESLRDLDAEIRAAGGRLYFFEGRPESVVGRLISEMKIDAVFVNRDYTPFSAARDDAVKAVCEKNGARFLSFGDRLLAEPEDVLKQDGAPYSVFTPFSKKLLSSPLRAPAPDFGVKGKFFTGAVSFERPGALAEIERAAAGAPSPGGGRKAALELVSGIGRLADCRFLRDYPDKDGCSGLSPYIKFGCVSVRELRRDISSALGAAGSVLTRGLVWRDFFTCLAFHFPRVFGHAFKEKYDSVQWIYDDALESAWRNAETGFPIVDAGMRELNETGLMHNRVRMICASFFVKDLHLDWRNGERFFASKLADYDPAVNNGNWQWCASTGADAQPWFRIFNPMLQQKKYDPNCAYVKKWLPALKNQSPKTILSLYSGKERVKAYPAPVIDHASAAFKAKKLFLQASGIKP